MLIVVSEKGRVGVKRKWNPGETAVFDNFFKDNLQQGTMASGEQLKRLHQTLLPARSIAQIRTRLHNFITGKQKIN